MRRREGGTSVRRIVLLTTRVPPAEDNIGRYTWWLAASLAGRGLSVQLWNLKSGACTPVAGVRDRSFARYPSIALKLLRVLVALRAQRRAVLVLQYNPFLYSRKGLPISVCVLPLLAHLVGCRVLVILHELCYPPDRDPRSWIWAVWQRIALWAILLGSDGAIVTSPARKRFLRRFLNATCHPGRRALPLRVIPVGSNIPAHLPVAPARRRARAVTRIGTFYNGLRAAGVRQVQQLATQIAERALPAQLVLIGAPPGALGARPYAPDDDRPGITYTPYLADDDASCLLRALDVFLALYAAGASGRHTSIAAAFAHGLCVISTSARDTDPDLFRHAENCWLVPYGDEVALLEATLLLLQDGTLRTRLGTAASRTYEERLSWPRIAGCVLGTLEHLRTGRCRSRVASNRSAIY